MITEQFFRLGGMIVFLTDIKMHSSFLSMHLFPAGPDGKECWAAGQAQSQEIHIVDVNTYFARSSSCQGLKNEGNQC